MPSIILSARSLAGLLGEWKGASPAYRGLADRIRLLVLDGRIPVGTRLPAERELADRLTLSRTTVTAAYRELRDAGYLRSVRGSGSVTLLPTAPTTLAPVPQGGFLDFSKAAVPPCPEVLDAAVAAAAELPRYMHDWDYDLVGMPELRTAIADRYTARGLPTDPDEIMVTVGAQHAIALIARTMLSRGDRVLVEMPSYPHAYEALRAAGARLGAATVSSDTGWDPREIEQWFERTSPALAYLMPDFHNPTGASMPTDTRERIAAAAERHGTVLVIDETTAELNIDRVESHPPFAATAGAPKSVITIGSVGKTVWGGLRIGWIRAERGTIRKLVSARSLGDLGTPILDQLTVAQVMPVMDGIVARRGEQLGRTRDRLVDLLADRLPEWNVPRVDGGIATWVNLGDAASSQLALAARSHGLVIVAGPRFGIDGAFERYLRIPISYPWAETERAVDLLAAAWGSAAFGSVPSSEYLDEVV
ncbi:MULTISPECIES: PLP-dependent aminotransferase family protein [unclassified Plantibacter]|jgi:DNA-binding transcriptional MocR family regulator|uniref:MocR-like transcription factor YczR n=1 Tax=unclassified Plantibacter TaxID=2624265 RepID=UPI003D32CFB8